MGGSKKSAVLALFKKRREQGEKLQERPKREERCSYVDTEIRRKFKVQL
jgi:hypothetical protein